MAKREALYAEFLAEASKRFAEALGREPEDFAMIVGLHAAVGRMRLMSSREVVTAAERLVEMIVETYASPNRSFAEVREMMAKGRDADPLGAFGEACRAELAALRVGTGR